MKRDRIGESCAAPLNNPRSPLSSNTAARGFAAGTLLAFVSSAHMSPATRESLRCHYEQLQRAIDDADQLVNRALEGQDACAADLRAKCCLLRRQLKALYGLEQGLLGSLPSSARSMEQQRLAEVIARHRAGRAWFGGALGSMGRQPTTDHSLARAMRAVTLVLRLENERQRRQHMADVLLR